MHDTAKVVSQRYSCRLLVFRAHIHFCKVLVPRLHTIIFMILTAISVTNSHLSSLTESLIDLLRLLLQLLILFPSLAVCHSLLVNIVHY